MKHAAIILSAVIAVVALIYLVISILPFLIAVASIIFVWWLVCTSLTGGFGLDATMKRRRNRRR